MLVSCGISDAGTGTVWLYPCCRVKHWMQRAELIAAIYQVLRGRIE